MIFGRDIELTALNSALERMLAGEGSVLFLTGEAGLGKTTLVHTWKAMHDAQSQKVLFLESACSIPIGNVDVGRLEALQPWADVVAQLSEKLAADSNRSPDADSSANAVAQNDVNGKVRPQHKLDVRKLMRDAAPAWLWALPFVGEVAHAALVTARLVQDQRSGKESQVHSPTGPDPSSSPITKESAIAAGDDRKFAAANQEQVFQQYVNLLTKIAEDVPLVIFLDDLHWADTSSCNLLFYLARQIADKKILVLATYRQDDALIAEDGKGHAILTVKNELLRYDTAKELALTFLNRDAIRAFLAKTFPDYVPDELFEQWLRKISDGNSLFMTQFVKTLSEDNHLDDHGRFIGDYSTVVIPPTALAVVEERTRRIDPDIRKLLMYATAEGEEFTTYVLERLTKKDPMMLLEELHSASAFGLVAQRGTGRLYANTMTGIFAFSHALFHKALYDSLLDMQKQHLHQQCYQLLKLEWDRLEGTPQRTATLATKLLMHATKCGEWETVSTVALAAAQEFWKAFNEGEALSMISHVLAASTAFDGLAASTAPMEQRTMMVRRAEALFLKGQICATRGRYDEASAAYIEAEEVFLGQECPENAADVMIKRALVFESTGSYAEAEEISDRALELSRSVGYKLGEARALMNIGGRHSARGADEEVLSILNTGLTIFIVVGDRVGEANALNLIGIAHGLRGSYREALEHYAKSLKISSEIGDRNGEGRTLHNMGMSLTGLLDYDEALSHVQQSLAIFRSTGHRQFEANSLGMVGNVNYHKGNLEEALEGYKTSLGIYESIGSREGQGIALANIGSVHKARGAYDDALKYYERALAFDLEIENAYAAAQSQLSMGMTLRLAGRYSDARTYLEQSRSNAKISNTLTVVANSTAELALLAEDESKTLAEPERGAKLADAISLLEEVLVILRELNLEVVIAEAEEELRRVRASV